MTDDQNPDTDDVSEMSPEAIRNLRAAANSGKKAEAEAQEAKRELAFMKAGINTDDKVGRMLFSTYDGDLEPDAIKTAADGLPDTVWLGSPQPVSNEPKPGEVQVPEGGQPPVSDPHAIGGRASFEREEDVPYDQQMRQAYRDAQRKGGTDDAIDAALSVVARAAKAGDPAVMVERNVQRS